MVSLPTSDKKDPDWLVAEFARMVMEHATRDKGLALANQLQEFRMGLQQLLNDFNAGAGVSDVLATRMDALVRIFKQVQASTQQLASGDSALQRGLAEIRDSCSHTQTLARQLAVDFAEDRRARVASKHTRLDDIEQLQRRVDDLALSVRGIRDRLDTLVELNPAGGFVRESHFNPEQHVKQVDDFAYARHTGIHSEVIDAIPRQPEGMSIRRFMAAGLALAAINALITFALLSWHVGNYQAPASAARESTHQSNSAGIAESTPAASRETASTLSTKTAEAEAVHSASPGTLSARVVEVKTNIESCKNAQTLGDCLNTLNIPFQGKGVLQGALVIDCRGNDGDKTTCETRQRVRMTAGIAILQAIAQTTQGIPGQVDGIPGQKTIASLRALVPCAKGARHYEDSIKRGQLPKETIMLAELVSDVADSCARVHP